MADTVPVVTGLSADKDEAINGFLANTHRAWRTMKIPGVEFPEERVLPLRDFVRLYRKQTNNEAMVAFWRQFSPILPDEFLITFYYHHGNFGIGRQLYCMVTNQRMILWDTKLRQHAVIALETCAGFQGKGGLYTVQLRDGGSVQVTMSSLLFTPRTDMMDAICKWSQAQQAAGTAAPAGAAGAEPAYEPEAAGAPLRWYYAQRGAAWATSLPAIIWLIVMINAGSGRIFLPGFLVIVLMGLAGFGGGFLLGLLMEMTQPKGGKKG